MVCNGDRSARTLIYTTWVGNGPLSFDSSVPQPAVGQAFNERNKHLFNMNGKSFGTRLRVQSVSTRKRLADWSLARQHIMASG